MKPSKACDGGCRPSAGLGAARPGSSSRFSRLLPGHSQIVSRPVGENLRVRGRISPMRAAHHRRQAAGVSKAHRGTGRARLPQPGTGTGITMSGPEPDRVSITAPADVPRHRVSGQVQRAGVAGRREGRRPGGRAACPAGNRMGPGEVCRVGGGRSEAADLGHQRPRRVQSAPTWRGGLNGNSPRRAPAPRYAAD